MRNVRKGGCPCEHVEPCDPRCTCINPASSVGCSRCCTYGAPWQQAAAAKRLVEQEKNAKSRTGVPNDSTGNQSSCEKTGQETSSETGEKRSGKRSSKARILQLYHLAETVRAYIDAEDLDRNQEFDAMLAALEKIEEP